MSQASKLVALIPAYNEAATIEVVIKRAQAHVSEIVVVNDCSTDATLSILQSLVDTIPIPLTIVSNEKNRGKSYGLRKGFGVAISRGATAIVTLDGDLQHNPEDIPRLFAAHKAYPHHLIIGARLLERHNAPWHRRIANDIADFWVSWASGAKIRDSQSGFRLYPTSLLQEVQIKETTSHNFVYESEIIIESIHQDYFVILVPIVTLYPDDRRESHIRPIRDVSKIGYMVLMKIISHWLLLPGLWRAWTDKEVIFEPEVEDKLDN